MSATKKKTKKRKNAEDEQCDEVVKAKRPKHETPSSKSSSRLFNLTSNGAVHLIWSFLDARTWYLLRRVNSNFSLTFRGLGRGLWETALRHEHAVAIKSVGRLEDEDITAEFKKYPDDMPIRCLKCNKVCDATMAWLLFIVKLKNQECDECIKTAFYAALQSKMNTWRFSRLVAETTLACKSTERLKPKHTFASALSSAYNHR